MPGVVPTTSAPAQPAAKPVPIRRKPLSKAAKAHLPRWMVVRRHMVLSPTLATGFINEQLDLIASERTYVIDEAKKALAGIPAPRLQSMGHAFIGLRITDSRHWVGDNLLLTLEAPMAGDVLPKTQLRGGDVVEIDEPGGGKVMKIYEDVNDSEYLSGVILSISRDRVVLVINAKDAIPTAWNGRLTIKMLVNDIPFRRTLNSLCNLIELPYPRPHLHMVAFSDQQAKFVNPLLANSKMFDQSLNRSQRDAVRLALATQDVALIHGPPGTGKTHTLLEIIRQLVNEGKRVLVCGPSNVSVDNLVERLGKLRTIPIVRIGHPARILPAAAEFGLDYLANNIHADDRTYAIQREIDELAAQLGQLSIKVERNKVQAKIRTLNRRRHTLRPRTAYQVIASARVVLSTLSGAASTMLAGCKAKFDVVVIDESTQATEAECWIAAQKAPKLILAGDHQQLPPTIKSAGDPMVKKTDGQGSQRLQYTMFERLRAKLDKRFCQMLTTQYRMHADIMKVSSERLYDGLLVADKSVATHVLNDLAYVSANVHTKRPIVYIDTSGQNLFESHEAAQSSSGGLPVPQTELGSLTNKGEAELAKDQVVRLVALGVLPTDIAVISPYAGQVRLLKLMLRDAYPGVEIGSVDGFQGREKEAVVLSFVHSNRNSSIGFLRDYRRINVAITRARRHLCVIADGGTVAARDPFLKALFKHLDEVAQRFVPA
ncbi:hypothetical protein GGI06_001892 [Coemansia sp. S85]|nr:hypothetical protein GGI06_001892 [Coemansia sp. S85]